jgi:hypothetical protein
MLKIWFSAMLFAPILLSATVLRAVAAEAPIAAATDANAPIEQVLTYGENTGTTRIGQVTSVSQLSDVKPTDWAFQALQSLVERYGCIAGYPDKTYRGNRALTRYEFAAGLNACLDRVNELIAASTANLVKKEDLDALKKMQKEFADELAEIRGKVDGLENRTTKLEKQQFSTTTKLNGEIILAVDGLLGGERAFNADQQRAIDRAATPAARLAANNAINPRGIPNNTAFGNRVRLNLDTSTTGQDRLRTRLQARNLVSFSGAGTTNTNQTRLGFDGDGGNQFELSKLEYRFPVGKNTTVYVGGGTNDGLELNDIVPTLSYTESSANGSISRFGRFNPIFRSATGSGIVINQKLGSEYSALGNFTASVGYLAPNGSTISGTTAAAGATTTSTVASTGAASPANKNGLFNGAHSLLAQLVYQPSPKLGIGFTYANAYYPSGAGVTGGTGSGFANSPFGAVATAASSYSVQAATKLTPHIALSGWVGFTDAVARFRAGGTTADPIVRKGDKAHSWNWAVAATFPDLLKEGNLGGIIFGMPPKVTSSDYGQNTLAAGTRTNALRKDNNGTTYHLEGFYRYKLNDNISVTPGLFMIFNPENNKANNTIYVGTLRTTFTF